MLNFIDTHVHLQDFKDDFALSLLINMSLKKVLSVSACVNDFHKVADLGKKYAHKVIPAFGIHPWYIENIEDLDDVENMLKQFPTALVGEIGLDGLRGKIDEKQHFIFEKQLNLAVIYERPISLHAVKAFNEIQKYKTQLSQVKFAYHGFVKNPELVKFINKCDGYFGLGHLFLKNKQVRELWKMLPKERVLFETDAPYGVNPEKYFQIVEENLRCLAEIADIPLEELEIQLIQNSEEFLNVNR